VGAVDTIAGTQLFCYPDCGTLIHFMAETVAEFVNDRKGEQLTGGSVEGAYQFRGSPRIGLEENLFKEGGTLRERAKGGAAPIDVKAEQQGLPILGAHDEPIPGAQLAGRVAHEQGLELRGVLLAAGAISGATEKPLSGGSVLLRWLGRVCAIGRGSQAAKRKDAEQAIPKTAPREGAGMCVIHHAANLAGGARRNN